MFAFFWLFFFFCCTLQHMPWFVAVALACVAVASLMPVLDDFLGFLFSIGEHAKESKCDAVETKNNAR